jgi:hypothetical protein
MLELFRRCRECEGAVEGNVVEGLEKLLLREDCSQLHGEIALWLKGRGAVSGRAVDGLCRVATDPESDGDGRRYAVLALAELKDSPTAARCLLAKLDGSDPDNLHRVARSLGGFRVEVDPIVEALRDRLAEPATDDEAVRLYTDEDLRIALLESLATYGPRAAGAAAEVTRLLRSDPKTSRAAVATLGEIGRLRDLDALEAYTRRPGVEQEDADAAVAAQDEIRGRAGWFERRVFELTRRDVKINLIFWILGILSSLVVTIFLASRRR